MTNEIAFEKYWDSYAKTIDDVLARRSLIKKTYLNELDEKERTIAEKIFGNYGSGNEDERTQIKEELEKKYKMFTESFFEAKTFECEMIMNCFSYAPYTWNALNSIKTKNKKFLEAFSKKLFFFEDIPLLDDRNIQKLLREIETMDLAKALVNASEAVREKVKQNMSKTAWQLLAADIKKCASFDEKECMISQYVICSIAMRLAKSGDIYIPKFTEDELVV